MRKLLALLMAAGIAGLTAIPSFATHGPRHPFPDPDPDPRVGTPNDPGFDCTEPDDEDAVTPCSTVWEEQYNLFGFAPNSTKLTATYKDSAHLLQGQLGQISGVSADKAWKVTIGHPDVAIAIVDTGMVWSRTELRLKVWLNMGELPLPKRDKLALEDAVTYDADGDGEFNADDYAADSRVGASAGPNGVPGQLDGQDLIKAFSNGFDTDGNGYIDDIAGWDFFDDDNDPYDASSYSSAEDHGSGRAQEAARQTNDEAGDAGVCPRCRVMMLRIWDSFVAPADTYAMAALYAADNGASVLEAALGVLQNSRFSQAATQYAFEKGVALMQVSSDLNTANHNYPTNYNNTVFVAGTVADAHGLGENNAQLANFLQQIGAPVGSQVPVGTWFRNSNLTQYGGHAGVVMVGDTGSTATGQASGAAGLIASRGIELASQIGRKLTSNEIKQIITLTAEDVLPENTVGTGTADHAQPGWDQHFGYGRVDLRAAIDRVAPGKIPPEAGIESPAWFMPLDPVTNPTVPITGFTAAERAGPYDYELAYAPGLEPLDAQFIPFGSGLAKTDRIEGPLGTIPVATIAALPQLVGAAIGTPPLDPHQYAFTVRLRVTDNLGNVGEDRKTLFVYHDPTLHSGWPKFVDTGGESSLRFADLDGNGKQEIVSANTSGEIWVYNENGTPASYFNAGQPVNGQIPSVVANHLSAPAFAIGGIKPSRGGFSTPAIGDLDRDGYQEIVAANTDRVYAFRRDGSALPNFPVAINPTFSAPALRTRTNHLKTGIFSSPVLGDLDKDSAGKLDIVVAAMDQRAYAWNMNGSLLSGWPVLLKSGASGAETINTPAVADINGDSFLDVIVATNEEFGPSFPGSIEEAVREGLLNLVGGTGGGGQVGVSSKLYAIHHDGNAHAGGPFLTGWPATLNGLANLLPLVGPGVDAIVADVDSTSAGPEVINGAFSGEWQVLSGAGAARYPLQSGYSAPGPGTIINTAEHPAVGEILPNSGTFGIFKGGVPLPAVVNLLLVGQNLPFNHVIQGWEAQTGAPLNPTWPQKIEDYQILTGPSIADVGLGPEREVIEGSGLYLLNAYGPTGVQPSGFPKFTGGWISGTTPVADIDNDGMLEIANWTREGNMFVWDTTAPACGGNNEWWGFRHDDYNTGTYGTDTRHPVAILDLRKTLTGFRASGRPYPGVTPTAVLTWTAPGDDFRCGTATSYEVRVARKPIKTPADWAAATPVGGAPAPAAPGTTQTMTLLNPPGVFYAVRSRDDAGNLSAISLGG